VKLFNDAADLEKSGYLFRIVDNGGETYDRITVTFCDGDSILCSETTICAHVEADRGLQNDSDAVESGEARDLRWIDLDPYLQRAIIADLNEGFSNYIDSAPAAASRDEARDWGGEWNAYGDDRSPIYREGDSFYIRDDERDFTDDTPDAPNAGPFATFRDAVFYMLPQDYDLSGPEYHTTVDLWSVEGGPAPLWDREAEPATPYEVAPWAIDRETNIAEARDPEHAAEIGAAWIMENPELAKKYQPAYINKVDRVVHRMELI
jgi:hypothetical protein